MSKFVSETFEFCPGCGARSAKVGTSPFHCEQCDFRFYFSPATAVGGLLTNGAGELLLLIRARDPGKGKYGLPGGFADAGETLEASLTREIFEETSLKTTKVNYLCSFPNTYTYHGVTVDVLDAFYVCEVATFNDLSANPEEVQSFYVGEATEDVLSNMAFESNRKAIEVFLKRNDD